MAQTKEFFTRIMQKHDTEANWALKTDFVPLAGEIIVYDKDDTHNYVRVKIGDGTTKINNLPFTLPTASSSILGGVKIGSNISISSGKISVPEATGSVKGVTIVYPAASCTTFSSDSGTVTPLAVQKGAKMFAITRPISSTANAITRYSNTTGDVKDSKIKIEDVTNTRDTNKTANVLSIPAEGGKKMVYGYCTDQVDGTSFIGGVFDADATEFPYAQGWAIGGTSGSLLWKGKRVPTTHNTNAVGSETKPIYINDKGEATACTYSLNATVPSNAKFTDTTYSAAGSSLGLVKTGGDVTISSGVITVNDDSHNHTIANVDSLQSTLDSKLAKLTYEWNKSYNAGGTAGYLLIGSFPMYDSNVTIDIDSTTSTTYHGTVVIATQNVSETSIGSAHTITVYGDPTGAISDAIRVVWTSGSRNYNVYFVPSTWSKNLIHIRALGNYLENIDESKICTQFTTGTAPATTSGLTIVNALRTNFNNYTLPVATSSALGGVKVGSNISVSSGTISLSKNNVTSALGYTPATAAQGTLADNAMPKSGGTFTGNVKAISTNRKTSGGCLRNILVVDSTGNTLQSTDRIYMYRQ